MLYVTNTHPNFGLFPPHILGLRYYDNTLKKNIAALAGTAQWIEHGPVNQRVAGLIPSQGTCLGEEQPHIDVPFALLLLSFTSL